MAPLSFVCGRLLQMSLQARLTNGSSKLFGLAVIFPREIFYFDVFQED